METTPEFDKVWGEVIAEMLDKTTKYGSATMKVRTPGGTGVKLVMTPLGADSEQG